jgi:DNA helicase-2/ATP-dependent DNA helicase PcrA
MKYTADQLEAINTIDENLQIIACAGSGKTQVISQRIINILKNKPDIHPSNILAFTYTEKAAAELKTRILKLCKEQIGEVKGLAEMYIGTIHAWCLQILQNHIYEFQKFSVLDEIKLKLFVDKNYNRIGMPGVGMDKFVDTGRFISIMGLLREAEIADGRELPEEWQIAQDKYEQCLQNHAYFDFTMIMTKAIQSLRNNKSFRNKLSDTLKYLIVDEYQDVNPVQEELIKELYSLGLNICVVGDDDQTIYQWRGGDVRYIQKFQERYTNVKYIKLEDNFRSTKGIVDTAITSITNNSERLPKVMKASGHQKYELGDILYNQYDNVDDEYHFIVNTILNLRGKEQSVEFLDKIGGTPRGIDFSDIAILIRTWKKAKPLMEVFTENNIPFIVSGVNELFNRAEIKAAKAIFEYLNDEIEEDTLKLYWQSVTDNIQEEDLDFAIANLEKSKPRPKTYYSQFSLQGIFWEFIEKAKLTEERFEDPDNEGIIGNTINEIIFYNLGMFSQIINDYETIYFTDKPIFRLKGFLKFLEFSADGYYPEGWLNNSYKTPNAVRITTVHQSKGLEFPVVFIPAMNKNFFPLKRPGGKQIWHFIDKDLIKDQYRYETSEEDERRLFYVAVTRSQKYLFISRAPENVQIKQESCFCKEISLSEYVISAKNKTFTDRPKLDPHSKNENHPILLNFSVLKSYFDCPYRFKLITLYGFNQPLSAQVGYGRSLHNVLMEIHRRHLDGEKISLEMIPTLIDKHLHLPYAFDKILEDVRNSTLDVSSQYFTENEAEFNNIQYAEKEIQIDLGEGIMVNGRMDLIKRKQLDGNYITTIVDFKSKEDAQTRDITMEQLSMYALGYQELTGEKADLLQIYSLDEGKHSKQTQELANDMIDEIKTRIRNSANDIRANKLEKTCEVKVCKSCFHKQLCSGAMAYAV